MSGEVFYFNEGKQASNLKELYNVLKEITEKEFKRHVNEDKNDFSEWVRHSLKNELVANKLRDSESINEMLAIIYNELESDEEAGQDEETKEEKEEKEKEVQEMLSKDDSGNKNDEESKKEPASDNSNVNDKKTFEHDKTKNESVRSKLMIRELVFGTVLGIFLGMILMAVLINVGVF